LFIIKKIIAVKTSCYYITHILKNPVIQKIEIMERINVAIIGAGVVGLAVAAELSDKYKEVYVFEKNKNFGQETSSRNSEVIHAGIYYKKDFLRSILCLEGKKIIYEQIPEQEVPRKKIGKIIIAVNEKEISDLEKILQNAKEKEIDLEMMTSHEISKIEPNIKAVAGIYSPSTGIIDSHQLMKYFIRKAENNLGINPVLYDAEITDISRQNSGYCLRIKRNESFMADIVVNCAGLFADKISDMAGIQGYKINFCKGEYFSVNSKHKEKIKHLIYPVPNKLGLGIHTVVDLLDNLKLGPNAFFVEQIDYAVNQENQEEFFESVKQYLPFLEYKDLSPNMSGIRPKLDEESQDFIIKEESSKGFPGFVNLIGIESPGLTASPAIAKYVLKLLKD
jgi:L-2-hydroxyglutarate oxidase LhgO